MGTPGLAPRGRGRDATDSVAVEKAGRRRALCPGLASTFSCRVLAVTGESAFLSVLEVLKSR